MTWDFIIKNLSILFAALLIAGLGGCSNFDAFYDKIIPENVKQMDEEYLEAVFARDKSAFSGLRSDMTEEDFSAALDKVFGYISGGEIIRTDVVGVNTSTSTGTSGKSKTIENIFEVQTTEGFTTVTLIYNLNSKNVCCELTRLNVNKFDASPVRAGLELMSQIMKIVGTILLIGLILILIFIIRARRKKRKQSASQ